MPHEGKAADAGEGGLIEAMVRAGWIVMAIDLPGCGELTGDVHRDDSVIRGVNYNILFGAQLIGRSVTGIQAESVVRALRFLAGRKDVRKEKIVGISRGISGPVLMHAAAFDPGFSAVSFIDSPVSWESVIRHRLYDQGIGSTIVPSALLEYDLPDIVGVIAPRRTLVIDPRDGNAEPLTRAGDDRLIGIVRPFYNSVGDFAIERTESASSLETIIIRWLSNL